MIQISIGQNGELNAEQRLVSPAIYLDHWALRAASEDQALGNRLAHAIEARGGTLVVSWANVAEFSNVDKDAALKAERFIDVNLPRVFFLDFNAFDVVGREAAILAGGPPKAPHADDDLLRLVLRLKPSGVQPITCLGMLTEVSGHRLESTERMRSIFIERIGSLREEYLEDDAFRALVNGWLKGRVAPPGTAIVLREIVAGLLRDSRSRITTNDALDFFHTVVPVSYCDFVLLDGRWRDQIDRLRTRLRRADILLSLAVTLSGADALTNLVARLESLGQS